MTKQPRFMVLIGGGISELFDAKMDLTFKQAVRMWVQGQKVCPTDCQMCLEKGSFADQCPDPYERTWIELEEEHESREAETINALIEQHRDWVEKQVMKQGVYNLSMLNHNPAFPNCHPFSRG